MRILAIMLLSVPLLGSCILAAGAGLGYVISERGLPGGSHEARVQDHADHVWSVVRESMEILLDPGSELSIKDNPRRVSGQIDLNEFEVEVQTFDFKETVILVRSAAIVTSSRRERLLSYILGRLSKSHQDAKH